jgi:eukaryotic-like serine/threonine-protein kinase
VRLNYSFDQTRKDQQYGQSRRSTAWTVSSHAPAGARRVCGRLPGRAIYLESQAAIKVLSAPLAPEARSGFLDEARTLVRLTHPHIIRLLDYGVQERTPFLVMEYAPGGTLRKRHPKGECLPLGIVVEYVQQVAEALQYAHSERLIHRDVKPDNLLSRGGEILLGDFGIALLAHSSRSQRTEQIVGTVSYMAPEQIQGHPCQASDPRGE